MSTSTNVVRYTSETGKQNDVPVIIEHAVNSTIRMNDPQYGLKTAAKKVRTQVERAKFEQGKADAIARQRSKQQEKRDAKIVALDEDIARVRMSLLTSTSSNHDKAVEVLANLEERRNALTK